MLAEAGEITKKYTLEVAKTSPPALSPHTQKCLATASIWFSIDLNELQPPAFHTLSDERFWDQLREIGVQAVYLKGLKKGGAFRTGLGIDPKWGEEWENVVLAMKKKGIALIGDTVGQSTGTSADFWLALKNVGEYPGLYHLIEIDKRDWKLLPQVNIEQIAANVPWLSLKELQKKGYVPQHFRPLVKESQWNATAQIKGADGKARRWMYLKTDRWEPVIDWLNPSFAALRIAAADTLDSFYHLGEKIIWIDAALPSVAKETLSLWVRKLGGFSAQKSKEGFEDLKTAQADLVSDIWTRPALLHALIAADTEALKVIYRFFLEERIEMKKMVHELQPFDAYPCEWAALADAPKKKFQYYDEMLTMDTLRARMLKEDVAKLGENRTWAGCCSIRLNIQDLTKYKEEIAKMHLLLAFFYAMQPGAFSFSISDLLGVVSPQKVHLMQPNENTLYPSFVSQCSNGKSFASGLKKILEVRKEYGLENGELIDVPRTSSRGLIVLLHRLKEGKVQLSAANFGGEMAEQTIDMQCFRQTTAIDLMSRLAEKKPLDSSQIRLALPPFTGKVILFQPQYYD